MELTPFCTARVGEVINIGDECSVHFVNTELPDFDAVARFLQDTYDRFATQLADDNAERSENERVDLKTIGGFGVQLKNRFGGEIEIGLGRQFCLLIRLKPEPTQIYCHPTQESGTLVFFVDGWHHTELEMSFLISREECIDCLRKWLTSNEFPSAA